MNILLIDNYDSFTYNLVQGFEMLGHRVAVVRNDASDLAGLIAMGPESLVISPGPGGPQGSGISRVAIDHFRGRVPVLGVCLGHQVLARSLGATVAPARMPVHGKSCAIHHYGQGIFSALPSPFDAARYHSLIVVPESLPPEVRIAAWTGEGEVMALEVCGERTWGVQFHPESYMTPLGQQLLAGFCDPDRQIVEDRSRALERGSRSRYPGSSGTVLSR